MAESTSLKAIIKNAITAGMDVNTNVKLIVFEKEVLKGSMLRKPFSSFTSQTLDVFYATNEQGTRACIKFWSMFERAKFVLEKVMEDVPDFEGSSEEKVAVDCLMTFLQHGNFDTQANFWQKKLTECDSNVCLGKEIFSFFAEECLFNERHRKAIKKLNVSGKRKQKEDLPESKIHVPSTSDINVKGLAMGHKDAWYGEPDMLFYPRRSSKKKTAGIEVLSKRASVVMGGLDDDDESPGTGTVKQGKRANRSEKGLHQTTAAAVTFSFLQKQRHPKLNPIVPAIWVSGSVWYAVFYDCQNDLLLLLEPLTWTPISIVLFWVILNHRLFCGSVKAVGNQYKSGYLEVANECKMGFPFVEKLQCYESAKSAVFRDIDPSRVRVVVRELDSFFFTYPVEFERK